jgi:sugar lactone lactonase YvrE
VVVALLCLAAILGGCTRTVAVGQAEEVRAAPAAKDEQAQGAPDAADEGVQVVSAFNGEEGGLPEGLIIDKSGNIYVTVGYPFWFPAEEGFGEVWKISPDGEISIVHAFPGGPSPAGLAVSPSGVLYFAYPNPAQPDPEEPNANGVYRLGVGSEPEHLSGSENIWLANGLALTEKGDLYVSDSAQGAVWRIPHDGAEAEIWLTDGLLAGCGEELPGANGVALWKESVYVANTGQGMLVRVPILKDGKAGDAEIVAGEAGCDPESDELFGMDGLALDVHGNVFAPLVLQNKLVLIDPSDGSHQVLLTGEDGLFNPASIAFGTGKGDRQYVFLSNFALLEPGPESNLGPGVLKYDVGAPGLPLP